ncbi:hypothetical protein [Prescottella agglutinans]|uniref:hypothetical protein n=1 Tax=Prescottella agglutinans TaxID=1644129 RepID=UPI003D969ECA
MTADMGYEDCTVRIDDQGVTIKRYYFPIPLPKRIPFARIKDVGSTSLPAINGRWRIWGTTDFGTWYNLDPRRPRKDSAVAVDTGAWISPGFTPDEPDTVVALIRQQIGQAD